MSRPSRATLAPRKKHTDDSHHLRIAFTGLAGAGKSTATAHIEDALTFSFAAPLKQVIEFVFGLDHALVTVPELKTTVIPHLGVTPRQLLQVVGTELFRDALMVKLPALQLKGDSIWIHKMLETLEEHKDAPIILIDDLRFENEADALRKLGFRLVKIVRNESSVAAAAGAAGAHASEHGCSFDEVIFNNGTRKEFEAEIDALVQREYARRGAAQ
jgi:hypothetical protein